MTHLTFQSKRKVIQIEAFKDAYSKTNNERSSLMGMRYRFWDLALEAGYRHVDSAEWYDNEKECGRAILNFCRSTGIPRADVFYTTKLKMNNGYEHTKAAIKKSLDQCGLGYIDLYLIHGPLGGSNARLDSWKAICEAQREGMLKSIGVSCFGVRHLTEIAESGLPLPAVNQIDLHPFMTRADVVTFCNERSIALEAWAPLVRGFRFDHPLVAKISDKHKKTPAQLVNYIRQQGYIPLPKSITKARIIANTNLFDFELSPDEMSQLDGLDEKLVTDWDPSECP